MYCASHSQINVNLTELTVAENRFGRGGAAALADCLVVHASLVRLDVGSNGIGDQGMVALATALASLPRESSWQDLDVCYVVPFRIPLYLVMYWSNFNDKRSTLAILVVLVMNIFPSLVSRTRMLTY